MRTLSFLLFSAAIAAAPLSSSHGGEAFPERAIQMVVPYGPGGTLDTVARVLADEMGKDLGQSIVVQNAGGAGGSLGVRRVVQAANDGYTVLAGTISDVVLASLTNENAKYAVEDLAPIGEIGVNGVVLVGRKGLPAGTLAELLDLARRNPGTLSYGTSGAVGSFQHLAMESLKSAARADIAYVPYKGAAQVTTDLLGNHIDLAIVGLPSLLPYIQSGRLRAYAVVSAKRDIGDPSIPSASETKGLEGLDFSFWNGLFAPKGTPESVLARLHASLNKVLKKEEVVQKFAKMGLAIQPSRSAGEFAAYVAAQRDRSAAMLRDRGIVLVKHHNMP